MISWPDVFSIFGFKITHSSECLACHEVYRFVTNPMYVELEVPEDGSKINESIGEYFNVSSLVGKNCDGCGNFVEAEKRCRVTSISETEYFIVILTRAIQLHHNLVTFTH